MKQFMNPLLRRNQTSINQPLLQRGLQYVYDYWDQLERYNPNDKGSLIGLPHPAAAVPDLLDRKPAGGVEDLREFSLQKAVQFADCHRGLFCRRLRHC